MTQDLVGDKSRSDGMMVALGFNPRTTVPDYPSVRPGTVRSMVGDD